MIQPNPSTALAAALVDEFARAGISGAVAAPGSRSTALVLALESRSELDLAMMLDERSAGFYALGLAKANGRPALLVSTSGTAAANFLPAVVEADAAGTGLIVLTADRPPELREVGANQTIDQSRLFGRFIRWDLDLGPAEDHPEAPRLWRSVASRAVSEAAGWSGRPGPVHLNVAFREPTVPLADDGRTSAAPFSHPDPGREGRQPWTEAVGGGLPSLERVAAEVAGARRGLIVAGGGVDGDVSVVELGSHLGWPVLATAESGVRGGGTVSSYHHLVDHPSQPPDLVIRFGTPGPSLRLAELLGRVPQIVVDRRWVDPGRSARLHVAAHPGEAARALVATTDARGDDGWSEWWARADAAVRRAFEGALAAVEGPSEPAVARLAGSWGADRLAVASSMPIRDLDMFCPDPPPLVCNRGASGIDGFVSTALGMAAAGSAPVALTGDLSLLHDSNGFIIDPRPDCVFVVVDNDGGGIFSFLSLPRAAPAAFERLFATPPRRDLAKLAALHGLGHRSVESVPALAAAVEEARAAGGCHLVVVTTDRNANVALHRRLDQVAGEAVAGI